MTRNKGTRFKGSPGKLAAVNPSLRATSSVSVVALDSNATCQAIAKLTEAVVELGVRLAALKQQIGKSRR